jgi:hypothetical protein
MPFKSICHNRKKRAPKHAQTASKVCSQKVLLLAFLIICVKGYGQSIIKGKVQDVRGLNLEFTSVSLKKDSVFLASTFSDSLGNYFFNIPKPGTYSLYFDLYNFARKSLVVTVSGDTVVDIVLADKTTSLDELVITAKKPIVEKFIDKLVYNPSASIATAGSNAYEILKRAPTVTASENGTISIKGISGTGVMINGRLLQLSDDQLMDYLKSIPAADVSRIEIIANPGAKYDAEGLSGLINIVLNKDPKKGLNGTASGTYEQTSYAKYNGNFTLNYRGSKVNVFGGSSLRSGDYLMRENVDNIYSRNLSPYYYFEKGTRTRNELSNLNKIGMDLFITKNTTVGIRLEHAYNQRKGDQTNHATFGNLGYSDSVYHSFIGLKSYNNSLSTNVNLTSEIDSNGQSFSLNYDFLIYSQPELVASTSTSRTDAAGNTLGQEIAFRNNAGQQISISSVKADYVKPFGQKTTLEAGAKFYYLRSENSISYYDYLNGTWIRNMGKSNDFHYRESTAAVYLSIKRKLTKKLNAQVGLRNENTFLSGESDGNQIDLPKGYYKLFPTLALQYSRNDNQQYSFNFSKRISRPDYSNLNPFRYYVSPNSYTVGNPFVGSPFLQPAFTNSFDFSFMWKQQYFFSLFANITDGQITQVPILESATNSYKTISVNLQHSYHYGLSTYLYFNVKDWWQTSVSLVVGINGTNATINGLVVRNQNFNCFVFNNHQLRISSKRKISAEVNLMYQPRGFTQGMFVLGRMIDCSASVKKTFKGSKSSLSLTLTDLFNGAYVTAKVDRPEQYSYIYGNYDMRGIRLTFSYKFGKTTIGDAREKSSTIEEEENRLTK